MKLFIAAATLSLVGVAKAQATTAFTAANVNIGTGGCSPTTTAIEAADLTTDCGWDAANPCKIISTSTEADCGGAYTVTNLGLNISIHAINIGTVGTATPSEATMELSHKAWHALCPYMCGTACSASPSCNSGTLQPDYKFTASDNSDYVVPGSTTGSMTIAFSGPSNADEFLNGGAIGTTYVTQPTEVGPHTFVSTDDDLTNPPSGKIPIEAVNDTACGTQANPCYAAGPTAMHDKCYAVTVVNPGLKDGCSGTTGALVDCPASVTTKAVKVAKDVSTGLEIGQAGWGVGICPFLCKATGPPATEVCVATAAECVGTVEADATETWVAPTTYTKKGSMAATIKLPFTAAEFPCPPTTTPAPGGSTGAGTGTGGETTTTADANATTTGSASSAFRSTHSAVAVVGVLAAVALVL